MPDRKLRSNFTPGTTPWAMRRAQWSALGLSDEDLEKPKIAIVNSSSQLASCFSDLDEIVAPLKKAIEDAGGVAFEVRTAAPSDAITSAGAAGQYILPSRDLIASDIEVSPEGASGGPLGLVRDGDLISVDVNARTLDLEVSPDELDARRAELPPLRAPAGCGWLSVYARTVAPLGAGAVLSGASASLPDRPLAESPSE